MKDDTTARQDRFAELGLRLPDVLLPSPQIDHRLWAVIACDQFTSEPGYWEQVDRLVGDKPSALRMILPECYLGTPETEPRIEEIRRTMRDYLDRGLFRSVPSAPVLVVRRTGSGRHRTGLLMAVDLEAYDYRPGARSTIRPSEGTILERIPPRLDIRRGAPLELPHILLLVDDPEETLLPPIRNRIGEAERLYGTQLMMNGGVVEGYRVPDGLIDRHLLPALRGLLDGERFAGLYGSGAEPFLLAVGDGNHSLATAKAYWEELKRHGAPPNHPARYALAEIVNLHDPGLPFEPIHRAVFGVDPDRYLAALASACGGRLEPLAAEPYFSAHPDRLREAVAGESRDRIAYRAATSAGTLQLPHGDAAAVTVQEAADRILPDFPEATVDYIHGWESAFSLGSRERSVALLLPPVPKGSFFRRILTEGPFPRKTFSLGEAEEKRYYFEARSILPE